MPTLPLVLFALMPTGAAAQPAPPLTVEQAVAQAINSNPRLSAAACDVAAAQAGVRSARSLATPEVVFTPALQVGGSDTELLIRQPLEINGTRAARTGVAAAQMRRTQAQAAVELRTLVFETKSAYYELARAQERAALARESLRFAEESDRIARQQVELGARPTVEATQTGIDMARARQQVALADGEAIAASAVLNTRMGLAADAPTGALALPSTVTAAPDKAMALSQALASRAEIAGAEADAQGFRQEARLARAEGLPDLAPQYRAGSVTRGWGDSGFGIGVTLPLLDYGSRRHRIRQAEESARAQADRVAAARNQVRQEVEQALARVRATGDVVSSYQSGVLNQARRLLDASRIGFEEGKTGIVALLEAQRTYRTVQSEFANARADHAITLAELERATGAVPVSLLPAPSSARGRAAK